VSGLENGGSYWLSMNTDEQELLRRYTRLNDEAAFAELVSRYIDIVHSAAQRQTGDPENARDITQDVFSSLARKAGRLNSEVILSGWLHQATRFAARQLHRNNHRRKNREQEAVMLKTNEEPDRWAEVAPLLDEAVGNLDEADRSAVLLRFFERRPLAEVGGALGISEEAARKRVSRAVEKLRSQLEQKGIATTSTGIAAVLLAHAAEAVPTALTASVASAATATAAATGWLTWVTLPKLAAGVAVLAVGAYLAIRPNEAPIRPPGNATEPLPDNVVVVDYVAPPAAADSEATPDDRPDVADSTLAQADVRAAGGEVKAGLILELRSEATGEPVAGANIEYWAWGKNNYFKRQTLHSDAKGVCAVVLPEKATHLYLITQKEGLADTKLEWAPERGDIVPASYQLMLENAVPIGGTVVDADDNPVAGAKGGFNNDDRPTPLESHESHQFGWLEVVTDEHGRWTMNRLADDIVGSIYGYAKHADHLDSPLLFSSRDRAAEQAMRIGWYAFKLGTGVVAEGRVVDSFGRGLPYANVLVGYVKDSSQRTGIASADGTFAIKGCPSGDTAVTASLPGFAATTVTANLGDNSKPVFLTLAPAKTLRLRVVNVKGDPVSGATVWLDTNPRPINDPDALMPQVDFSPETDPDGRATWNEAPDLELRFDIFKPGFMRLSAIKLRSIDQEYLITMHAGLTVSGTVADAVTGKPIPKFRILSGWPESPLPGSEPGFRWSSFDRDALNFSNGTFRHVYDEPMVTGMPNPGYGLKFMAEGYAPYVSRAIKPEEQEVTLEVELQPTAGSVVTVVSADGRPVSGADYAKTTSLSLFRLANRRIVAEFGSTVERTDASGQIRLAADPELTGLMIANDEGFISLQREQLAGEFSVRLQPWGNVSGTLVDENGSPLPGVELDVQPTSTPGIHLTAQTTITTGAEGRFTFASVPPGEIAVVEKVPFDTGSARPGWTTRTLGTAMVQPGQTATVTVVKAGIHAAADEHRE